MFKMILAVAITQLALMSNNSFAIQVDEITSSSDAECVQLSRDGRLWSRTPEKLCKTEATDRSTGNTTYFFELSTGLMPVVIMNLQFDTLISKRGSDGHIDSEKIYQHSITNSLMNDFKIHINPTKKMITIAGHLYYYR